MKYYAIIDDKQAGPFELEQLAEAGVRPDTYVWCKDMDDWKQAREVGDICRFFRRRLFDREHPALAAPEQPVAVPEITQQDVLSQVPPQFRRTLSKADPAHVDWNSFSNTPDYSREPSTWWPFPMVFSLLFFFPLGLLAISQARKSQKAWRQGQAQEAHEYARRGKMAAGMSFSFGFVIVAALIQLLF